MTELMERLAGRPPSAREVEVLGLIARGMGDAEVGAALFVSVNTVKTHVRRVLAKLGAHGRGQAVAAGYRLGLLESPGLGVLRDARPLLAGIPACPCHGVSGASPGSCADCGRWAAARRVLGDVDAILDGGRDG